MIWFALLIVITSLLMGRAAREQQRRDRLCMLRGRHSFNLAGECDLCGRHWSSIKVREG